MQLFANVFTNEKAICEKAYSSVVIPIKQKFGTVTDANKYSHIKICRVIFRRDVIIISFSTFGNFFVFFSTSLKVGTRDTDYNLQPKCVILLRLVEK